MPGLVKNPSAIRHNETGVNSKPPQGPVFNNLGVFLVTDGGGLAVWEGHRSENLIETGSSRPNASFFEIRANLLADAASVGQRVCFGALPGVGLSTSLDLTGRVW